jgi:hypothetical protein
MTATSSKTLRNRNLAAAKRSLKLIQEAVTEHLAALEAGGVSEGNFTASVVKYEQARLTLGMLDALGVDATADEATVEVRVDALEALVLFAHGFVTEAGRTPGSPIDELTRAVYPDGIVPGPQEVPGD